jgi:glycosyltransferase involved in cell wall biosynthesis
MSSFPPRECGIATFTKDLTTAMDTKFAPTVKSKILAMNKNSINIYNYHDDVVYQLEDTNEKGYADVAEKINHNESIKLVNIQHEFGLFGGKYGNYLISFLDKLNKPTVVTFHSVLPTPNEELKEVVRQIAEKVNCIVVMNNKAIYILRNDYGINTDIAVIPHGIPSVSYSPSNEQKLKLGHGNKIILSSFGLMSKGKGYEYVVEGLQEVVKKFPNVLYIIMGQTHPTVMKEEGEKYRNFLESRIKELGLKNNVKFYNKYLDIKEIIKYLKASDIYICSNKDPNQITSGTLVYAMGCGRAVVSTPFLHAKEVVNEERGMLAEFNNPKSFSDAIIKMLSNPKMKETMENNAYAYTRHMSWPNVALSYMNLFNEHIDEPIDAVNNMPNIKFKHIKTLTDDFGIIQFADHTNPDPGSGYTLDDNARAMIINCMHYDLFRENYKLKRIKTYLNFISYVQQDDGSLYNYVDYDRKVNLKDWTYDAHARALWSLGHVMSVKSLPLELKNEAKEIFDKGLNIIDKVSMPRPFAFTITGLYLYNKARPSSDIVDRIRKYADKLVDMYNQHSSDDWKWFDDKLTYSNGKIPESMFHAYLATKDKKYLDVAVLSLDFLNSVTFKGDSYGPIGQEGWYFKDQKKAEFDQQPVDAGSIVATLLLASRVTKKKDYLNKALIAFQWFLGKNPINQVVYDESTGGCRDGVGKSSVNQNQGAESTIAYLMARLSLEEIPPNL